MPCKEHAAAIARMAIASRRCPNTSSDADRIACLDAALIGRDHGAANPAPAARIDLPSRSPEAGPAVVEVGTQDGAAAIGEAQR